MKNVFDTKNVSRACDMMMFAIEKALDEAERRGHKSPELVDRLKQLSTEMTEIEDKWQLDLVTALFEKILVLDVDVQQLMRRI